MIQLDDHAARRIRDALISGYGGADERAWGFNAMCDAIERADQQKAQLPCYTCGAKNGWHYGSCPRRDQVEFSE